MFEGRQSKPESAKANSPWRNPLDSPAPGPKLDALKVEGDWQDAVKKSFQKKKPAGGWPK